MRAGEGGGPSERILVSQSGCAVTADFTPRGRQGAARPLRLRADIGTGTAVLLYGLPCMTSDKGRLVLGKKGFSVDAERDSPLQGCARRPYSIDFVKQ